MSRFGVIPTALVLTGTLGLVAAARARGAGPGEPVVTLAALLDTARSENPEIKAAEARYAAALQRPIQEGTLPDPTLGVRYHNEESDRITFGTSDFSFVELSAEQEVPFPGKLGLRAEIASREAARERAMRDATILMVLAKVAASFADLAVVDRSTDLIGESIETLGIIVQQADESYGVGTAAQQDALRARLERDALQERLTMLRQKRVAAESAINALLNRPAGPALPRTPWSDERPALEPLPALVEALAAQAPELRAAEEDLLRSETALRLARREYFPDLAFMGSYMNKNGLFPEWEFGMRITVPLYFWRRQRAGVAEASFAKQATEQTRQNVRVSLEGRLRELHSMAESAQRLMGLYTDALVPQAQLTLKSARASYAVGKVDLLTTLSAFTAVLEYQMRYAEEVGNFARARAEIGPLVGRAPLDGEKASP